jgi:hypothetical protein
MSASTILRTTVPVLPATATTTILANAQDLDQSLQDSVIGDDVETAELQTVVKWLGLGILICLGVPLPKTFDNAIILAIKIMDFLLRFERDQN